MGIDMEVPVNATCEHCKRAIYRWPRATRYFLNTREVTPNPGENVAKCDKSPTGHHNP